MIQRISLRMKLLFVFLIAMLIISFLAPQQSEQIKVTSTYPATVCPAVGNKVSSIAGVTYSKIGRRSIDGNSKKLVKGRTTQIPLANNSILVEGNAGTAITFANNKWKAVVPCSVSNGQQWFAGGSGALTSKSFLYIVNSGFSESNVEVEVFTPTGALEVSTFTVAQNSTKKIAIDTLAPGVEEIVISVKTLSGRVSSFLFDERKKGLKSLGADFVSPIAKPEKQVRIVSVPGLIGKTNTKDNLLSHSLRVLVTGKIDANIEVTINSNDGNFVPDGLADVKVNSQRVVTIPLTYAPINQPFSVVINSDQPIISSVLSSFKIGRANEITWSTSSDTLSSWSANLTGSRPIFTFVGKKIDIFIKANGVNGKKIEKKLSGSDFTSWQSPVGLNRVQVIALGKGISGGVIFLPLEANIGVSTIPMNNGANLETASEPVSDASVITRR
ncbi:MAG: hypothetical protein EBU86_00940 [Actinobacteria bacterium]|nr:hypothetical protein [Actinomycetota bacterium]